MKFIISILSFFIAFHLSAQPKISFDKTQHDFGKVKEADGTVSYNFTFKNTGTSPLIIQDVKTTCGCTTPEWTRQPISPGNTGSIKVTYDVKGRPGVIDRSITVHNNSVSSPVTLNIVGEVISVEKRQTETFRFPVGTIRLDNMHVAFNRIYTYDKPSHMVTAYNPNQDAVKITFTNLPAHIKTEVNPAIIRKGEKAVIKITYDAAKKKGWGYETDHISLILNDNMTKEYKLTVTATIEEDFSRWTNTQLQNAPVASIDQQIINAGKIKRGEKKTYHLKLTNNGKSKLLIRKVESASPMLTADITNEINAGESANLTVTYDSSNQNGEQSKAVTITTNDPKNTQIILRVKANVTD